MNISKIVAISLIIGMSFNSASFAMDDNIHQAAERGDLGRVQELLQSGVDVDARDKWQFTPLHRAAEYGHEAIARLLLQHGAAVDARDQFQLRTPLHCAAKYDHEAIARLLLENRAAVDARSYIQWTPLHYAAGRRHDNVAQLLRDWPLYETYMRRQGLLRDGQTIARAHAQAPTTIQALVMATHQRLGAQSPARVLDRALLQFISALATLCHSPEEIHQIAERERRNLQDATDC